MSLPHRAEALSDAFVRRLFVWLTSVAYIGPNLRTERPRKTIIGTEVVAHVTCDSDTTLRLKGQLVADVLNSRHAGIGATWRINTKMLLCWNSTATWWINMKILSTCRGGGILCHHTHSLFTLCLGRDLVTHPVHHDVSCVYQRRIYAQVSTAL